MNLNTLTLPSVRSVLCSLIRYALECTCIIIYIIFMATGNDDSDVKKTNLAFANRCNIIRLTKSYNPTVTKMLICAINFPKSEKKISGNLA